MKKILKTIGIILLLAIASFGAYVYFTTPYPTVFKLTAKRYALTVGAETNILREIYPDESFLRFFCQCEDRSIAMVKGKITLTGKKLGQTKLVCKFAGKVIAEAEVSVER